MNVEKKVEMLSALADLWVSHKDGFTDDEFRVLKHCSSMLKAQLRFFSTRDELDAEGVAP